MQKFADINGSYILQMFVELYILLSGFFLLAVLPNFQSVKQTDCIRHSVFFPQFYKYAKRGGRHVCYIHYRETVLKKDMK